MEPSIQSFDMHPLARVSQMGEIPGNEIFDFVNRGQRQMECISNVSAWHRQIVNVILSGLFDFFIDVQQWELFDQS